MTVKSVKRGKNSLINDVISLKKPSTLDKIIEKVPKPKGAVPNFGLPKWKHIPLESKIPMIPGPKGAYNISRKKLGKQLWKQTKNAEFNLNDPYNNEMEFSYDSLHDPNLARYFSSQRNIRRLLKLGLITKDLDAKCSLRDYNMYRKFLKKLHNDSINQELKHRQNLANEKRILEFADLAARKEIERLNIEERKMVANEKARKELKQLEKKKMKERREKAEKLKKRMELVELAKAEEKQKRIAKLKAKTEYVRRKRAAAIESERGQVFSTLIEWARKESIRRKARRERLTREKEEKRIEIEEKWQKRKEVQKIEMARKKSALRYAEEEREKFIKNYTKKIERQRANAQKRFENIRRFIKCSVARRGKRMCCRKSQVQIDEDTSTKIINNSSRALKAMNNVILAS